MLAGRQQSRISLRPNVLKCNPHESIKCVGAGAAEAREEAAVVEAELRRQLADAQARAAALAAAAAAVDGAAERVAALQAQHDAMQR